MILIIRREMCKTPHLVVGSNAENKDIDQKPEKSIYPVWV